MIEYKIGLSSNYYFTFGGGLTYSSLTNEDDFGTELTFNGISYKVFGGLEFIVNNKVGVFLGLGPEFGTLKDSDSDAELDISTFGVGLGFGFYF